jgi:ribosomal protein S18 acetylase RimI-like enzyme
MEIYKKFKVKYRRISIRDIEDLVEFRIRFLNELRVEFRKRFLNESIKIPKDEETELLKKELRKYFSNTIPSNDFIGWIAENKNKKLAVGGLVVWRLPGIYGKRGFIWNMYTVPEARRQGIATRLLAELIREAKSLGLGFLRLRSAEKAISLYKKAGFSEPYGLELVLKL